MKTMSNKRGDSCQPCPICQDEFGLKDQVGSTIMYHPMIIAAWYGDWMTQEYLQFDIIMMVFNRLNSFQSIGPLVLFSYFS